MDVIQILLHGEMKRKVEGRPKPLGRTAVTLSERTLCVGAQDTWVGVSTCGHPGEGGQLFRLAAESPFLEAGGGVHCQGRLGNLEGKEKDQREPALARPEEGDHHEATGPLTPCPQEQGPSRRAQQRGPAEDSQSQRGDCWSIPLSVRQRRLVSPQWQGECVSGAPQTSWTPRKEPPLLPAGSAELHAAAPGHCSKLERSPLSRGGA